MGYYITTLNNIDLKNKVAIVTGGVQGFGLSIVKRFLNSGCKVAIWDKENKLHEDLGAQNKDNYLIYQLDLTNFEEVDKTFKKTVSDNNKVDILVNNAGIAGPSFTTWEYPNESWHEVINVDLNAVFYCSKIVVPHMISNNYGRIVNIASIAGKEGNPNAMPYSAAKAGVIAMTKSLGKELADYNIAVNCVTPAAAKTRIFDQISKEHIEYMLSKIPRKRFVKVDELASMVSWLACEENSFTTGAVFDLSGGRATY